MMKKFLQMLAVFVLCYGKISAQCPNNGQNPSSAFPACGTAVFSQTSVPACNGKQIPVPVCTAAATTFTDINPYYYKFTCYVAGPLEFNITPNTSSDDYDWQLFDITGRNPNDIYADASLFVACNWSGETGTTGTSATATSANGCEGTGVPLITKAPTLIAGHEYLLMVSHFTSTNQSGYNLTFSTATASLITDPNTPKIQNITTTCGGKEVYIKLNKKILCESIAANGSDFSVAGATIVNATGVGCTGAFDTDSIIVVLSGTLATNNYLLTPKVGTDGNILVDNCNNNLDATGMSFAVYNKPNPNFTYQIINETCKADTLKYTHNGNNSTNKWQWTFDGNPLTSNSQTQQVVYNNFTTRTVKLVVSNPLCIDSITQNIPIANHTLISKINASRDTTCPNNPETFSDASIGNVISRFWDFKNGQTSNLQFPPTQIYPVLPINKFYDVSLVVQNSIGCRDSAIRSIFVRGTIPTEFDSIIPPDCAAKEVKIYFKQAMYCNSISPDGSEFIITGPSANSIIGATINCLDTVGTVVTLQLANALTTGIYQLSLKTGSDGNTIINDCGIATLPKTLSFQALAHINPTFTYNAKWGCKADTITFGHTANNNANNWNWNFVDGSPNIAISNSQNPTVIFNDVVNNHNVQLIVSNGVCNDTSNQQVTIIDHGIKAKYICPDTTCGLGNTIFTDSSKGIVTKWYWSFGAGLTSDLQQPKPVNYPLSYVYFTYPTQLIAQNIVGCLDTSAIKNIVVKPSSPAQMDKLQYDICSPDSIIIYFNSPMLCNTVASDGSDFTITGASNPIINTAYIVNCNNGLGRAVVLKLSSPINKGGYYQINLKQGNDGNTILNDCGIATAPAFIGFVCHPKVDATFSNIIKNNCKADTITFTHDGANEVNKWSWFVNGQLINPSPKLTIAYTDSSLKNILLIVANATCKDTSTKTFTLVHNKIKAKFSVSNTIVCPADKDNVSFIDNSIGNISIWRWDFGNGDTSTSSTPINQKYKPPTDKINPYTGQSMLTGDNFYTTTAYLIVGNATPCYDTARQILKITSNCLIQVPTAFTPNGDGLNDNLYPLNTYKASKFNFRVYDRAGTLIFESSTEGSKWNGTNYLRIKQPAGTYVWTLNYTDKETGKEIFLKGTSVLIR